MMCSCRFVLVLVVACSVRASTKKYVPEEKKNKERSIFDKAVKDCLESKARLSCFSDKAAMALERSMNRNVPISEGINLLRNNELTKPRTAKSLAGFKRLAAALSDFLDTHTISIDLTESEGKSVDATPRKGGGGEGGGGGGNGLFNVNSKDLRREKKYYQYAFMVLLGIFGLTGPLVMKVLGAMAAHALLASKAALIIVGGVALKKLFEQDHHSQPKVKVHTVPLHEEEEHEYDRMGNSFSYNYIPYQAYSSMTSGGNHPYSAYSNSDDFAPIFYGTQKKSR